MARAKTSRAGIANDSVTPGAEQVAKRNQSEVGGCKMQSRGSFKRALANSAPILDRDLQEKDHPQERPQTLEVGAPLASPDVNCDSPSS
jgi:hypothetical protein